MQWRTATVGGTDTTGFEAFGSQTRQESERRQAGQGRQHRPDQRGQCGESVHGGPSGGSPEMGAATVLPVGLDLPCTEDPELFFAESPQDVEQAKAMCRDCRARIACLTGALERREPWGVWGGELLIRGAIVPRKRPRGRPRKTEVAA